MKDGVAVTPVTLVFCQSLPPPKRHVVCLCGARVTVQLTLNERGCCVPNCNWPLIRLLMPASSYMNNAVWHSAPSSARKEYLESLARVRAPAIGVPQYHTRTRPHIPSKAKKATRVDTEANVALPALTQIGELFDRRIVGGGVGQVYAKRAEETYTFGPALRIANVKNMGKNLAPNVLRIFPRSVGPALHAPHPQVCVVTTPAPAPQAPQAPPAPPAPHTLTTHQQCAPDCHLQLLPCAAVLS